MFCYLHSYQGTVSSFLVTRLVGVVVKASASVAEDPGFDSRGFFRVESYLKTGTPVATLPGTWPYSISAGTGSPGFTRL